MADGSGREADAPMNKAGPIVDLMLDLAGLFCPQVVLRLADAIRDLSSPATLSVISTDPLSAVDIPVFLRRHGHSLLSMEEQEGRLTFVIETAA